MNKLDRVKLKNTNRIRKDGVPVYRYDNPNSGISGEHVVIVTMREKYCACRSVCGGWIYQYLYRGFLTPLP